MSKKCTYIVNFDSKPKYKNTWIMIYTSKSWEREEVGRGKNLRGHR